MDRGEQLARQRKIIQTMLNSRVRKIVVGAYTTRVGRPSLSRRGWS